ncbi:MAG: dienelactone hydrolase family protein [Acidimicrobiia bacterium]|nr:dienelactone hydrolase family protein [Acidimicrobiia bacterium]
MTTKRTLDYAYQGPKRGVAKVADRAVLLAHGAGADMHAATLTTVTDALSAAGIPSLRFQYPYRSAGRKAPDRPPVLLDATRTAIDELARRTKLDVDRLVIGGRSMGGRYCSMVAGDADDPVPCLGLLLLGYPLHAAGKPERERSEHFPRLTMPVLFVSGTRDSLASKPALIKAARKVKGPRTFHWIESGDHGFKPLKRSGLTVDGVLAEAAAAAVGWVTALPD